MISIQGGVTNSFFRPLLTDKRGEDGIHRRQVRGVAAAVGEPDYSVGADYEGARHLEYVTAGRPEIAASSRECRLNQDLWSHHFRKAAARQAESAVGIAEGIGEASKPDTVTLAQTLSLFWCPLGDRRDRCTLSLKRLINVAQRAKVLVAEGSAEVAQKDQHQRMLAPQFG